MIALFQQLFHLTAKILFVILKLFVVEADIRISRYRQNAALPDLIRIKQYRKSVQQYILGTYEAFLIRKKQIRRCIVRHRNDTDSLMPLLAFEQCRSVEMLIRQMRDRVIRTDKYRRQNRQELRFKEAVYPLHIIRPRLFGQNITHAAALKLRHDRCIYLLLHGEQAGNCAVNMLQLPIGRPTGLVIRIIGHHAGKIKKASDTHHEKLIEISGKDRDKFQPLQYRDPRICRLLEHASVESQPAQFTVLSVPILFLSIL